NLCFRQRFDRVECTQWCSAGEHFIEYCTQAINVARRPDQVPLSSGLFGTHIRRCSKNMTTLRRTSICRTRRTQRGMVCGPSGSRFSFSHFRGFSQAPIDYQGFTELSQHDVGWFQIPMNDSFAVGTSHGLANSEKALEKL